MKWSFLPSRWKKEQEKPTVESIENKKESYLTPRDFFQSFQETIDEFFNEFPYPEIFSKERSFFPKIDISENDKEIVIKADVPGIDEKDLDISISKDAVIIQGEKKYEHEEKQTNYYKKERSYGSFRRVIPLPVQIDESKVEATYKNGVVTLRLPKSLESLKQTKKIPIKIIK